MRSVLGQLRRSDQEGPGAPDEAAAGTGPGGGGTGLERLPALRDAVTAAGAAVTVTVQGEQVPLSAEADHSAYRILQESLTNVLRHAGPGATARVCLRYQPEALTITVTDDGSADLAAGVVAADGARTSGHGIRGMYERAASVGGSLAAGPRAGGGFQVQAVLPAASGDAAAGRGESS